MVLFLSLSLKDLILFHSENNKKNMKESQNIWEAKTCIKIKSLMMMMMVYKTRGERERELYSYLKTILIRITYLVVEERVSEREIMNSIFGCRRVNK